MGCINSKSSTKNEIENKNENEIGNFNEKYILENKNIENTSKFSLIGSSCYVRVIDVYDGDTITIIFQFANNFYHKKCRIHGIDTPEIRTKNIEEKKAGYEAKEFLKKMILGKILWANFSKEDKYGRLLARLSYEKDSKETIDQIMIKNGHGYVYEGGKKQKFQ